MNDDFLFLNRNRHETAELCCKKLFMHHLDLSLDGAASQLFKDIEQVLSSVSVLHITNAGWLSCDELKPMQTILDHFKQRGGHIAYEQPMSQTAGSIGN
jgi:hypothetical protein